METFDMLLIRACKSKKPLTRLNSVINRKYLSCDYGLMIYVLSKICDKYKIISGVEEYITAFHSTFITFDKVQDNLSTDDIRFMEVNTLISKIRLSSIDKFPGLILPAKFK